MPASLTHYYFAENVLRRLPKPVGFSPDAYFWGAQGPDFLFCHHYQRFIGLGRGVEGLKKYGNALHSTRPSLTLSAMRGFLEKHPEPLYRQYVQGFLCHYALDSTAHPYVNALAKRLAAQRPRETEGTMHGEIESALDAVILRRETGKLPSEVRLKGLFPKNEGVQRCIARLYRYVLWEVYQEDIPEEALLQSTKDAHFVFALITDRTGLKHRLFDLLERGRPHEITSHIVPMTERMDVDYANIQQEPWRPEGDARSFFQLYEEAMGLAERLIRQFDQRDLASLTGERPFG